MSIDGTLFLEQLTEKLKYRIEELDVVISEGQKDVESMHEYYWENYTEMDEYGYENYDNQQALLRQVNANQDKLLLKHRFEKMLDSPFFGRVDFIYDGEDEAESFYIGIGNFAERTGSVPLVYDWRAPVSGLFYDFDQGPASYEAPLGTIEGEIVSKWQYKIRNGKMIYGFESDVKIDDEILKQELGSNGDVQLKKYCADNPKRAECNYPKYKRQDSHHSGGSRKWENFGGTSPDRISVIPRQRTFEIFKYFDSFSE